MTTDHTPPPPTAVSIAGHVGSGKSAVSRLVAERTGWRRVSTGAMFREIAARREMSVLELNRHAETHPEIDDEVDGHLRLLAESGEQLVIDSRMAWHFVPDSFKVYLVVDFLVGAERVLGAARDDERYQSLEEAAGANTARQEAEADRYRTIYGVHRDDWRNYELIVDTTDISPHRVADIVVEALDSAATTRTRGRGPDCRLAPGRLIPTDPDRDGGDDEIEVFVYAGIPFITNGHVAVGRALGSSEVLVRCRLAGYDPASGDAPPPEGHRLADILSPGAISRWEEDHGVRLRGLPRWLRPPTVDDDPA
jgi:CMP/dCMP kinase